MLILQDAQSMGILPKMAGSRDVRRLYFTCSATAAGPAHLAKNIPNQDAFSLVRRRKFTVLVVSDGLGSKPLSHIGSKRACQVVVSQVQRLSRDKKTFCKLFSGECSQIAARQFLQDIVHAWRQAILPHQPKDCSATCLFAVVAREGILAARLGDGMICLLGRKRQVLLSDKDDKEFSNITHCLSDSTASQEFHYEFFNRKDFSRILLTTDGISADLEQGQELPFAGDLFRELEQLPQSQRNRLIVSMMSDWPVPHHTDDKTLVLARLQ